MTGILALDQGTTGTKAYLWRDGSLRPVGRFTHRQIRPRPGWVEHDPVEILGHLRSLAEAAGPVAHAGLANQGETVVAWDAATLRPAVEGRAGLRADLEWSASALSRARPVAGFDWRAVGAWLAAAHSAGALGRLLEWTLRHARDRVQFGRAIGGFQAVQHQLAVMAEEVAAARAAVRLGCAGAGGLPQRLPAALAKARTAEAAVRCTAIAHAVHGAMGVTAEFDLQLLTRRLHDWRLAFGTESHWHACLGREWLASGDAALEFVRARLS
jgi:acyl-CoA dehydrogenase